MKQDMNLIALIRCEEALSKSKRYSEATKNTSFSMDDIIAIAGEICYMQGFNDSLQTILTKK